MRANDRVMLVRLTFGSMTSSDEEKLWKSRLAGSDGGDWELEVSMEYEDGGAVDFPKKTHPQRLLLLGTVASNIPASNCVLLWKGRLTLQSRAGVVSFRQAGVPVAGYFRAGGKNESVFVEFRLATNVTSKSHGQRRFRFRCRAGNLTGVSHCFDLLAKHPGANQVAGQKRKLELDLF